MRVITGRAKGRKLQMVPGDSTRPITDRAKEALFSILGTWVEGIRMLDLFGGTGAVGIECLSRGADHAHFLDNNRHAIETIRNNLRHCQLEAEAVVERSDSFAFLKRYQGEPFDLIYVAPPQYQGMWHQALQLIDERPALLESDSDVIVQIHPKEEQSITLQNLREYDRRLYGAVLLLFYTNAELLDDNEESEEDGYEEDGHSDSAADLVEEETT